MADRSTTSGQSYADNRAYETGRDTDDAPGTEVEDDTLADAAREEASPILPPDYVPISLKFKPEDSTDAKDQRKTRTEFSRYVTERIKAGVEGRRNSGMDWRVLQWRDQYEGVVRVKTEPWEDSSNLHIPKSRTICNAIHAHLYKTLCGIAPFFEPSNTDPTLQDDAQVKGEALQSILENVVDFRTIVRQAIRRSLIDRCSILKPYWKREVSKVRKWEQITLALRQELAAAKMTKQIAGKQDGEFCAVYREIVTYDAVDIQRIDVMDYGMYPAASPTHADAQLMFNRYWASKSALWTGVKSGMYDGDAVEILAANAASGPGRHSEEAGGDRARLDESGIDSFGEITDEDKPYECFQCLVRYDADEEPDGIEELVLVDIELHTGAILRAELYPYFHDRPFFIPVTIYEREGFFYGYSLMEILEMPQAELNTFHNQRVDRATLENNAPIVARPGMKKNLEKNRLRPGLVLFDDNPRDALVQVAFGTGSQRPLGEEQGVAALMEEVSGANATVLAQPTGGDQTYGEIERTLQSTNTVFDVLADCARASLDEVANQIADLYGQYQTDDFTFGVAGAPDTNPFKTITPSQMRARVGFRAHGTSALMNPVLQAQLAEKLVMFGERSPFVKNDLTLAYKINEYFCKYGLQIRNPAEYIGTADNAAQMQQQAVNAPPPPPETRVSRTERADEVSTLATMLKENEISPEQYLAAAHLALQAKAVLNMVPTPQGATVEGATDDTAGYDLPATGAPSLPSPQQAAAPAVPGNGPPQLAPPQGGM